jgi:hypothetical protein
LRTNASELSLFLALEIIQREKCKLDERSSGIGGSYTSYVGIKIESFDVIEQNRTLDSLGEDWGLF